MLVSFSYCFSRRGGCHGDGVGSGAHQVSVHHWFPASPITNQVKRSLRWCEGAMPLGVVCPENPQGPPDLCSGNLIVRVIFP